MKKVISVLVLIMVLIFSVAYADFSYTNNTENYKLNLKGQWMGVFEDSNLSSFGSSQSEAKQIQDYLKKDPDRHGYLCRYDYRGNFIAFISAYDNNTRFWDLTSSMNGEKLPLIDIGMDEYYFETYHANSIGYYGYKFTDSNGYPTAYYMTVVNNTIFLIEVSTDDATISKVVDAAHELLNGINFSKRTYGNSAATTKKVEPTAKVTTKPTSTVKKTSTVKARNENKAEQNDKIGISDIILLAIFAGAVSAICRAIIGILSVIPTYVINNPVVLLASYYGLYKLILRVMDLAKYQRITVLVTFIVNALLGVIAWIVKINNGDDF